MVQNGLQSTEACLMITTVGKKMSKSHGASSGGREDGWMTSFRTGDI